MSKVLLKHVGNKNLKNYQKDVAKISKIAITAKAENMRKLGMYSKQELCKYSDYNNLVNSMKQVQ